MLLEIIGDVRSYWRYQETTGATGCNRRKQNLLDIQVDSRIYCRKLELLEIPGIGCKYWRCQKTAGSYRDTKRHQELLEISGDSKS